MQMRLVTIARARRQLGLRLIGTSGEGEGALEAHDSREALGANADALQKTPLELAFAQSCDRGKLPASGLARRPTNGRQRSVQRRISGAGTMAGVE